VGDNFLEAPLGDETPTQAQLDTVRAAGLVAITSATKPVTPTKAASKAKAPAKSRAVKAKELQNAASDSEFSDAEPELGNVASFWRFPSNPTLNKIHVQNELKPVVTACAGANETKKQIANMKEVRIAEHEFTGKYLKRFCATCAQSRPECFPDGVLAAIEST